MEIIVIKAVILATLWFMGAIVYNIAYSISFEPMYIGITLGPLLVTALIPLIYFLFFVW